MKQEEVLYGDGCAKLECPKSSIAFLTLFVRCTREAGILYSLDANQRRVDLQKLHEKSGNGGKAIVDTAMEPNGNDSFQSNPWEITFFKDVPICDHDPHFQPEHSEALYSIAREKYSPASRTTCYNNASIRIGGIFALTVNWDDFEDLAYIVGIVKVHTQSETQQQQGIFDWPTIMENFRNTMLDSHDSVEELIRKLGWDDFMKKENPEEPWKDQEPLGEILRRLTLLIIDVTPAKGWSRPVSKVVDKVKTLLCNAKLS